MRRLSLLSFIALCFVSIYAQNIKKPSIYYLHVESEIKFRFSKTVITSKVVNRDSEAREAVFDITLPNEAFITSFTLIVKGKEYDGIVKEKRQAKKEFEAAKAKGQSAAHIVAKPRETNKFQLQVNVAAKGKVTFKLTYRELLKRINGLYNHVIFINPGQVVDDFGVKVLIEESRNITKIITPAIQSGLLTEGKQDKNNFTEVTRPTSKRATISYSPGRLQQKEMSNKGISGQFVVQYDVERDNDAGDILHGVECDNDAGDILVSYFTVTFVIQYDVKRDNDAGDIPVMDGYFVHFVAPEGVDPIPMDVAFVLDESGSMYGTKMRQMKESMFKIIDDMKEEDRIMLIPFESRIKFWNKELVYATPENKKRAKEYITNSIDASGGTNINTALKEGIKQLSKLTSTSRAPVLVFLTDGQASSGITDRSTILSNVKRENEANIPIFSLAFGRGADYDFVKKVAAQNNGVGRRIYEDSDAALQIAGFYKEISTVLMKDISFKYVDGALNETTVTDTKFNMYFKGSELVVAGKVENEDKLQEGMSIKATGRGNSKIRYTYPPLECIILPIPRPRPWPPVIKVPRHPQMMEKLWAYLTIKQLLTKKDKLDSPSEIKAIDDKILKLSLKYQFVTPLTSMVVTLPDDMRLKPPVPNLREPKQKPGFSRTMSQSAPMGSSSFFPQSQPMAFAPVSAGSMLRVFNAKRKIGSSFKPRPFPRPPPQIMHTQTLPPMTTTTITTPPPPTKIPGIADATLIRVNIPVVGGGSLDLCLDIPFENKKTYIVVDGKSGNKGTKLLATVGAIPLKFTSLTVRRSDTTGIQDLVFNARDYKHQQKVIHNIPIDGVLVSIIATSNGLKIQATFEANKSPKIQGLLAAFKDDTGISTVTSGRGTTLNLQRSNKPFSLVARSVTLANNKDCFLIERNSLKHFNLQNIAIFKT